MSEWALWTVVVFIFVFIAFAVMNTNDCLKSQCANGGIPHMVRGIGCICTEIPVRR